MKTKIVNKLPILILFFLGIYIQGCNKHSEEQIATSDNLSVSNFSNALLSIDEDLIRHAQRDSATFIVYFKKESNLRTINKGNFSTQQLSFSGKVSDALRPIGISENKIVSVFSNFNCISVELDERQLLKLCQLPIVASVSINRSFNANLPKMQDVNQETSSNVSAFNNTDIVPPGVNLVWGAHKANEADSWRTAWVMDTGCDLDHQDLNVDVARSASFVPHKVTAEDFNGHGTHVSGTIGAKYNNSGVVGVAPGARIVPVKVLDSGGGGQYSWLLAGLNYIASHATPYSDVVNISIQTQQPDPTYGLDNAIKAAADLGIIFTICAGNYKVNTLNYPMSRIVHNNVKVVGAIQNSNFAFAVDFPSGGGQGSNYGTNIVTAPGVNVLSTHLNNGTATMSGTSMAAPHVAGLYLYTKKCNCPCDPPTVVIPFENTQQPSSPWSPGCRLEPGNIYTNGYPYGGNSPLAEVKRIYVYRPGMIGG